MADEIVRVVLEGDASGVNGVNAALNQTEQNARAASRALDELRSKMPAATQGRLSLYEGMQGAGASEKEIKSYMGTAAYNEAKTAAEQLSAAQQRLSQTSAEVARPDQQVAQALNQSNSVATPSIKTFEELGKELNAAKKAFDGTPASIDKLKSASEAYNEALKQVNDTTGKTKTFTEQLSETFTRQILRIGIGVAIWTTLRTAQQEIKETIKAMEDYSLQVGRFAANTQQSVGAATEQYSKLRDAAAQAGYLPTTAAAGIQEAGRFNKSAGGQQDLVTQASKLSEAMGLQDITQATNALGEANLATGQSYEKLANLAYAAYQQVGGDASQFMTIFPQVQALVDATGGSFDELFVTMTRGMAASGRSASEVGQVLNRFTENINGLRGDKILDFAQQLQALTGVNALNPDMTLRTVDEILKGIQQKWDSFAPEVQQQVLDILAGSKLKSTLRTAGTALGAVYGDGTIEGIENSLNAGLAKIDSTFGAAIKRRDALIQKYEQEGEAGKALASKVAGAILPLTSGASGGLESEIVAKSYDIGTFQAVELTREETMKRLTGLSPEDVRKGMAEFNQAINNLNKAFPISTIGIQQYLFTDKDLADISSKAAVAGAQAGKAFAGGMFAGLSDLPDMIAGIAEKARPKVAGGKDQGANRFDMSTPQGAFGAKMMVYANALKSGTEPNAQNPFSSLQQLDMTKYSQDEINAAKQLAVQLAMQEVQLAYELTLATTGDAEVAKRVSDELQNQIDKTVTLIKTSQGLKAEWGAVGKYMQDAMQEIKEQKKSEFYFQRLRDVDPSQSGMLQGLITMYTQMLQKMGSDEPVVKINTLMGENNVYKQFTGSMTALQLALEDLTKVEKAQLAGTWNLPSGATALVPIQSLDIQRWNKSGGGGIDPAALAGLMGATNQSGEKVSTAMGTAADRITAAIREQYQKAGLTPSEQDVKSQSASISQAIQAALSAIPIFGNAFAGGASAGNQGMSKIPNSDALNGFPDFAEELARANSQSSAQSGVMALLNSLLKPAMSPVKDYSEMGGYTPVKNQPETKSYTPVNVNMSALPLKANFNANLSIVLNGAVVARSIFPILYQMMIKMSSTTPTTGGGLGALR